MNLDTSKPIKSVSYNGVDVPLFQEAPVLLWTNASPTSNFNGQTINVAGGDYDGYIVEIRNHKDDGATSACLMPKSNRIVLIGAYNTPTTSVMMGWREIMSATDTTVVFGMGGYINRNISNFVSDTRYGVPTRIWGVKFTL